MRKICFRCGQTFDSANRKFEPVQDESLCDSCNEFMGKFAKEKGLKCN